MFPISEQTLKLLRLLIDDYPDVTSFIRSEIVTGKPVSLDDEEDGGFFVPYSEEEQLEICRDFVVDFIETPCRAAINFRQIASAFDVATVEFMLSETATQPFPHPSVEDAKKLDEFMCLVNAFIDSLKPEPPARLPFRSGGR
ncbi:hypothetical protein RI570_06560 [Brucella pseudogrignonensis]|uniref:hypothetical protein n=1 Tax=Brucella pseudogrignonensis TaxID=419475 RepID=UPI0028BB94F8|nr:hypothetical protein [Brucella pseudogrignonensis]MDT6939805.1 hypothetical protein [Brucella pseudogrignonensis]